LPKVFGFYLTILLSTSSMLSLTASVLYSIPAALGSFAYTTLFLSITNFPRIFLPSKLKERKKTFSFASG
jgi:hypothetical protein